MYNFFCAQHWLWSEERGLGGLQNGTDLHKKKLPSAATKYQIISLVNSKLLINSKLYPNPSNTDKV